MCRLGDPFNDISQQLQQDSPSKTLRTSSLSFWSNQQKTFYFGRASTLNITISWHWKHEFFNPSMTNIKSRCQDLRLTVHTCRADALDLSDTLTFCNHPVGLYFGIGTERPVPLLGTSWVTAPSLDYQAIHTEHCTGHSVLLQDQPVVMRYLAYLVYGGLQLDRGWLLC